MDKPAIYLDHNATTPLLPEAADAVRAALEIAGNPSSAHAHGRAARKLVDAARDAVAELAGANRRDVVFTGSATEALAQAIIGGAKAFSVDEIIIGAGEHPAVTKAAAATGLPVSEIGLTPEGVIDVSQLTPVLARLEQEGRRALFAVQAVNNETGVVQTLSRIEALVGPTPHVLVIDAVQALGRCDLEFASRAADMMAVSGHKIGAPAGVGALLMKPHCDEVRLIHGGGQELGRRGGTEPVLAIAGFGGAARAVRSRYDAERVAELTADVESVLHDIAPDAVIFGGGAERIGNCVAFAVPGLKSTVAMMGLDLEGVSVSSGSACSSGKVGRSHVLAAMGVVPDLMDCALRVSLGWNSTKEDVAAFAAALKKILARSARQNGKAA